MVGPILFQEMLLGSRRNPLYVFRWFYAAWLVMLLTSAYLSHLSEHSRPVFMPTFEEPPRPLSAPQVVGARFAETFVSHQLILLALVVPAFAAGAITDEKRRGTLEHLLTTDLEDRHILLGKLLARSAQVLLVALTGLPLFALMAGFGGMEPFSILVIAASFLPPLFGLGAATLLASVLCRQTRDAVLALYLVITVAGLIAWRWHSVFSFFDPLYAIAPAWGPWRTMDLDETVRRLLALWLAWGGVGGVCLALAVWRLRPAYRREQENPRPQTLGGSVREHPPIPESPVRWREQHLEGLAPTPFMRRIPQWLALTLVAGGTTVSSLIILGLSLPSGYSLARLGQALLRLQAERLTLLLPDASAGFLMQSIVVMFLASLVVGIRCSGSVTGEREKKTWEALLLTPLSATQILRDKLWGVMSSSYWYLLAYAGPALLLSACGGVLALFWTVLWLAVTVLAMYYIGSVALWCSVRSRSSWRALLGTLLAGYLGGCVLSVLTSPIVIILIVIVYLMLLLFDWLVGTHTAASTAAGLLAFQTPIFIGICIGLAALFLLMSRMFLAQALRWVADRERTRHWYDEPVFRRAQRRPRGAHVP
jgi:ABC-type transport system involved in multi-copper enzyme maturation permease subunit